MFVNKKLRCFIKRHYSGFNPLPILLRQLADGRSKTFSLITRLEESEESAIP